MRNNCFIPNPEQGIYFAISLNQSGFSKENKCHSMYSEYNTAALNLIPVVWVKHGLPMSSGTFPLLSSKSPWCLLLTDQNLWLYREVDSRKGGLQHPFCNAPCRLSILVCLYSHKLPSSNKTTSFYVAWWHHSLINWILAQPLPKSLNVNSILSLFSSLGNTLFSSTVIISFCYPVT